MLNSDSLKGHGRNTQGDSTNYYYFNLPSFPLTSPSDRSMPGPALPPSFPPSLPPWTRWLCFFCGTIICACCRVTKASEFCLPSRHLPSAISPKKRRSGGGGGGAAVEGREGLANMGKGLREYRRRWEANK